MFRGAFWRGGRGDGGPLSLNPLPAPVSAEGFTDTEMRVFDGRVAKYGPGQNKESFCPTPGNNSFFASRRFVYTRSDFLSFGSFFFSIVVRDSARHGSKVTEGLSNIEVPEFRARRMTEDDGGPEMAQGPQPGASHPHAPGVQMT